MSPMSGMDGSALHFRGIGELSAMLSDKDVSPVEITRSYLDRIDALDARLGAFITLMRHQVLAAAREAEHRILSGGRIGPLDGIPLAVKDIIYTKGVLTSAGSRVLADHVPDKDSTIIERLYRAGALLLGKLNLSEFAMGGTLDHPFGTPRNPWNEAHAPGGSSSGSAVAVAGGLCAGALGSDTGGSIMGPASFCGVVGIRPTYGRVTRHGVVPMCWSMDTIGPMTRSVEDCAIMLQAIAGRDKRDLTSSVKPVPNYLDGIYGGIDGLRVAVPTQMLEYEGLDGDVLETVNNAVGVLEELGASADEISLPTLTKSGAAFTASANVDAASFHAAWLRQRRDDYDWNTRTRLESAMLTTASAYIKAQRVRVLIWRELLSTLDAFDVIVLPTGPVTAPTIETSTGRLGGYYHGQLDLGRRMYTSPAPLAGLPALSVPCGFSRSGLPIGLQIIGKPFDEGLLFRVGYAYESATEWHTSHPQI